jgi:tRNA-guanine family transglycosylase
MRSANHTRSRKWCFITFFKNYVKSDAVLANTYHLYLEPGNEIVKKHGGFAKMMNYDGPTFTDSGGFQVFSLGAAMGVGVSKIAKREDLTNENLDKNLEENKFLKFKEFILRKKFLIIEIAICLFVGFLARIFWEDMNLLLNLVIMSTTFLIIDNFFFKEYRIKKEVSQKSLVKISENGVEFRSVIDGSKHFFTPEKSMEIQHDLGGDIFFAFDECTSPLANLEYQKESLERTHRWAKRSLTHHHELLL